MEKKAKEEYLKKLEKIRKESTIKISDFGKRYKLSKTTSEYTKKHFVFFVP